MNLSKRHDAARRGEKQNKSMSTPRRKQQLLKRIAQDRKRISA